MYAIVCASSKQYKVQAGQSFKVDSMDLPVGAELDLTEVLFIGGGDQVFTGTPNIQGAKVTVVVFKQARAPKILVLKKKRRQGYRKLQGHRQSFTGLFVKSIEAPGVSAQAENKPKLYTEEVLMEDQMARQEQKEPLSGEETPKQAVQKRNLWGTGKKQRTKKKVLKKKREAPNQKQRDELLEKILQKFEEISLWHLKKLEEVQKTEEILRVKDWV